MDAQLVALGTQLADTTIRNTAMAVADRVATAKARKRDQDTIAELEDIVSSLQADKNELVRIAQAYEEQLAGQRISETDVEYLTAHIVPLAKELGSAALICDI